MYKCPDELRFSLMNLEVCVFATIEEIKFLVMNATAGSHYHPLSEGRSRIAKACYRLQARLNSLKETSEEIKPACH